MTNDPLQFVRQRIWARAVETFFARLWANWTWANTLSVGSIVISGIVAWNTLLKVSAAEASILSWEVQPEEPEGTYLKVSAAVSNTGDKQLVIVSAGHKALRRTGPPESSRKQRKAEGADRVQLAPGKIALVEVFVPINKALFAAAESSEYAAEYGASGCGDSPHFAVVVDVLLFGVDGEYRGATTPMLCIYLKGGKIIGVRKFRGSGKAYVLPWETYTFSTS